MSSWTHVCGCIYYDYFPLDFLETIEIEDINEEDITDHVIQNYIKQGLIKIFEKDVPTGREGGIEYSADVKSTRFGVSLIGDLRDYEEEDTQEIIDWFKRVTVGVKEIDSNFSVRQAVLEINCSSADYILILIYERVDRLNVRCVMRKRRINKLKGDFE